MSTSSSSQAPQVDADADAYTLDQLAFATGVSTRTIRFYQFKGVLPRPVRRGRGALYDGQHVARLRLIGQLQDRGLSLRAVRHLLREDSDEARVLSGYLGLGESLREEDRPDPFAGDVKTFRRWVRGRVDRARVVDCGGRVAFVAYADVQRPEGWLIQGVYTWPEFRRRGLAAAGVSDLCREAFASGTSHVQLAVVEGNAGARALYEGLGFEPFGELRTILFAQA